MQLQVVAAKPATASGLLPSAVVETNANGPWTSNNRASPMRHADRRHGRKRGARRRIEAWFDDFRRLFPAALCYTKIVPVDEVVTLTLFYREDDHLRG